LIVEPKLPLGLALKSVLDPKLAPGPDPKLDPRLGRPEGPPIDGEADPLPRGDCTPYRDENDEPLGDRKPGKALLRPMLGTPLLGEPPTELRCVKLDGPRLIVEPPLAEGPRPIDPLFDPNDGPPIEGRLPNEGLPIDGRLPNDGLPTDGEPVDGRLNDGVGRDIDGLLPPMPGRLRDVEGRLREKLGVLRVVDGALREKLGALGTLREKLGVLREGLGMLRDMLGALRDILGALREKLGEEPPRLMLGALRLMLGALRLMPPPELIPPPGRPPPPPPPPRPPRLCASTVGMPASNTAAHATLTVNNRYLMTSPFPGEPLRRAADPKTAEALPE